MGEGDIILPLPDPILNGHRITHAELRALHGVMRETIRDATSERCLDGPRLLFKDRGESYVLKAHGRDREGNLLASVTVRMPWSGDCYVRWARFVHREMSDRELELELARGWRQSHS